LAVTFRLRLIVAPSQYSGGIAQRRTDGGRTRALADRF
jgi:hypothetical protein